MRMSKRQFLSYHSAKGDSEDMSRFDFDCIEQSSGIVCHIGYREWFLGLISAPYTTIIKSDNLEMRRESFYLFTEALASATQTPDQEQRLSLAVKLVIDS
jgi:hypothetical protein